MRPNIRLYIVTAIPPTCETCDHVLPVRARQRAEYSKATAPGKEPNLQFPARFFEACSHRSCDPFPVRSSCRPPAGESCFHTSCGIQETSVESIPNIFASYDDTNVSASSAETSLRFLMNALVRHGTDSTSLRQCPLPYRKPALDFSIADAKFKMLHPYVTIRINRRRVMNDIYRREMFKILLGGAVVAACGMALTTGAAQSAPFPSISPPAPEENLIENAVVVVRRRRRRVCFWRRGRRVCTWRWV